MYVKVRVTPGARKETLVKEAKDTFTMSVKQPAERNLANERIRELIAAHYGVAKGKVRLVTGHRSGSKVLDVALEE